MPHHGGLEKGQKVHVQRAVLVGEGNGHRHTGEHRADVHPAVLQQGRTEGNAVGGVVVAADEQHGHAACAQLGEKAVEQLDRLDRRHELVVYVARDEHAVRLLVVQNGEDLPQDVRLILKHGKSDDTLAEMQVGEVEKFHRIASLLARPGRGVMLPL